MDVHTISASGKTKRRRLVPWIRRWVLSYEQILVKIMQIHHSQWEQFQRGLKEEIKALLVSEPPLTLLSVKHMDGWSSSTSWAQGFCLQEPRTGVTTQHVPIREQRNNLDLLHALMHIWECRCGVFCRIFLFLILVKYLEKGGTSLQYIMRYKLVRGKHKPCVFFFHLTPYYSEISLISNENDTLWYQTWKKKKPTNSL